MLYLRKYQLDIIFLFFALLLILNLLFYGLKFLGADPRLYEWYVGGPLIIFYAVYLWGIRQKINIGDRRALTPKTTIYWFVLSVILFLSADGPLPAREYWTIQTMFIIFTILLADSYWDFKKLSLRTLFKEGTNS